MRHRLTKGLNTTLYSWMATFFFFTTGIFAFVPYAMRHFKDAKHSCVHCGRLLATYRFGSGPRAHVL